MLLRQIDNGPAVTRALTACFSDGRDARLIEHSVGELLAQRVNGLALRYKDLNDHNALPRDPLLAVTVGKLDPLGASRRDPADRGHSRAATPTINRLDLGKLAHPAIPQDRRRPQALEATLLTMGVRALPRDTTTGLLDFDASDHPLYFERAPSPCVSGLGLQAPIAI